jgi:type I restriction-modification system DNA methylase subunit
MRKDAGVDGDAQRLGQLSWLLFLKIFDTQEEELELEQDDYSLPIRNAICGEPGRRTAKVLPAMRCWNSSTTICSQN